MTIRKKLSLSFLVVVLLFAMNLVVYFWGNQRRQSSVEALRRAVLSQALISSIGQHLNDIQKQVNLLSQVATDTPSAAADPVQAAEFNRQLERSDHEIMQLHDLAEPGARANIDSFAGAFRKLSTSWQIFHENFGVDQTKAITELAVRSEPLAQEVLRTRLPQLQKDEDAYVESTSANFYRIAKVTDQITIVIFALSSAFAIGIVMIVSGRLTLGLRRLKQGAALIGSGDLGQRIEIQSKDELSDLAKSFNEMTTMLSAARDQLNRVNAEERQKSEELSKAMDQLRKAQDQLVVQQKLASLGALTAGIAHEIKNPLNFVTNFAEVSVGLVNELRELLPEQGQQLDPKELEEIEDILKDLQLNVTKIQEHGDRADGIVRNMLMHSRGHSGEREMTNLNSVVSEYVKLAYHGMRAQNQSFNVAIKEEFDPSVEPINVVEHDISRVILNIANNACYSAYEKKVRLGESFAPVVEAKTRNLGDSVEIRIRDNGDGIPPEIQKRIFDPFFTTKPAGAGTGLGLSMSYDIIVHQHKGELRAESEPGNYAEFIITLPNVSS